MPILMRLLTLANVYLAERVNSKGLLAVVFRTSPHCLKFIVAETCEELHIKCYPEEILALKANKKVLTVCLSRSIYVHSTSNLELLLTVDTLPASYGGICAISENANFGKCYLAYPCSEDIGHVLLMEIFNKCDIIKVAAHKNNLAAIAMNYQQTLLATASVKGTVVRVISIPVGRRLYEFRRGLTRSARVYSLSFSTDSGLLCCSSSTGTIHIFKLQPTRTEGDGWLTSVSSMFQPLNYFWGRDTDVTTNDEEAEAKTWSSYAGNLMSSTAFYVPQQICEILGQNWSFAKARLPRSLMNVSIVNISDFTVRIYSVCEDGYLYCFSLDIHQGGECIMENQCRATEFGKGLYFLENHNCLHCRQDALRNGLGSMKEKILAAKEVVR